MSNGLQALSALTMQGGNGGGGRSLIPPGPDDIPLHHPFSAEAANFQHQLQLQHHHRFNNPSPLDQHHQLQPHDDSPSPSKHGFN